MTTFNENVGIKTDAPLGGLHIKEDSTGAIPSSEADDLVIEKGSTFIEDAGISILSHNQANGNIYFGDKFNNKIGSIKYSHQLDRMHFNAYNKLAFYASGSGIRVPEAVDANVVNVRELLNLQGTSTFRDNVTFLSDTVELKNDTQDSMLFLNLTNEFPTTRSLITLQVQGNDDGFIGNAHATGAFSQTSHVYIANRFIGLRFGTTLGSDHVIAPCSSGGLDRDDSVDLGSSTVRFDNIYATNGTIQTSDKTEKRAIRELTEAEQRVAIVAKGLLRAFKWRTAVAAKGEEARVHFGIMAQDLQEAFQDEGLDARDYGLFIETTWWEHGNTKYSNQEDIPEEHQENVVERKRLGVRYAELMAFIIAAL